MVYTVTAVALLCLLATRAASVRYFPSRCSRYCVTQAQHAFRGGKLNNPTLQLCRLVSAITYLSAARTLSPDNASLMKDTGTDVSDLQTGLVEATKPLIAQLQLNPDQFKAVVA
jgi:hypothetical protein